MTIYGGADVDLYMGALQNHPSQARGDGNVLSPHDQVVVAFLGGELGVGCGPKFA